MVAIDTSGNPVTVSTTGNNESNIILWMDHRAVEETNAINATQHDILKYVGGKVSLEMQCPKLLWLKQFELGLLDESRKIFRFAGFFNMEMYRR